MTSARLPADVVAALRKRAGENGETVSDLLRRGALMVLGICPTCGRPVGGRDDQADEDQAAGAGG